MGTLVEPTHYKLVFEDGTLQDADIVIASMSLRETFAYQDKVNQLAGRELSEFVAQTIAKQLVSWDLEKTAGEPWPMTLDGFLDLPDRWTAAITVGWVKAVNGTVPLDRATPDPSVEGVLAAASQTA
jgi:hypothetical protein